MNKKMEIKGSLDLHKKHSKIFLIEIDNLNYLFCFLLLLPALLGVVGALVGALVGAAVDPVGAAVGAEVVAGVSLHQPS